MAGRWFQGQAPVTSNIEGFSTEKIDIGGRCLAMTRGGHGSPAVVLETGLGAESEEWSTVQAGADKLATVLRYDRARRGASDAGPSPRNALDMVDDLRLLLRAAGVSPPYVLVGHSYGGLLVRLYASRFRAEVSGLVLVDAMHEDQFESLGPLFPPPSPSDPQIIQGMRGFWTEGWRNPDATVECIDFVASLAQARAIGSLDDLPLHVITAGTFLNTPFLKPEYRPALQQQWNELQDRLLAQSSRAIQSFAPGSGHFVQRDDPEIVVNAIREVLERVKAGIPTPS